MCCAGSAGGKGGSGDKGRLQTALLSLGAWHVQLGHVQVMSMCQLDPFHIICKAQHTAEQTCKRP